MKSLAKRGLSHALKDHASSINRARRIVPFKDPPKYVMRYEDIVVFNDWVASSNSLRVNDSRWVGTGVAFPGKRHLHDSNNDRDPCKKDLGKKANLGAMIDQMKALLPHILNKSLPKSLVSKNILLRICPTHFEEFNAYFPTLRGHVSYYATCKTLQLVLTSIVLNPKVKLHIQSIRVLKSDDSQCLIPDSTKVYIRWTTCSEGCHHLSPNGEKDLKNDTSQYQSTSDAKLGSHSWSKLDTSKIIDGSNKDSQKHPLPSISTTISSLTNTLIGLTKEKGKLERIISGIFIFELNEDNDEILVHTVEDINVVERNETEDVDGELRIC